MLYSALSILLFDAHNALNILSHSYACSTALLFGICSLHMKHLTVSWAWLRCSS